ncbi:MAG: thiamine diphosphokinase [Alphaproteobacteria bacterium]|nr:thiamine diphosphokinase [Alphaproteobacteria bacterium]
MISNDIFDFSKFKSILCLNGKLPSYESLINLNLPIIAADGAINKLFKMGITANIVIGDLDSVSSDILHKVPYLKEFDQNYSDFQKAYRYITSNNLNPSVICGISGGFLDHILNNINIFIELKDNVFMDDEIIGFYLRKKYSLKTQPGTKISIFGIPHCKISTNGLKWELDNELLEFPGKNSSLNRAQKSEITIDITEGCALIIIYKNTIDDAGLDKIK